LAADSCFFTLEACNRSYERSNKPAVFLPQADKDDFGAERRKGQSNRSRNRLQIKYHTAQDHSLLKGCTLEPSIHMDLRKNAIGVAMVLLGRT
jgi:hypothetical protein